MAKWKWAASLLAADAVWSSLQFRAWRRRRLAALAANGVRVETAVGPIEYAEAGTGPVVIVSHGGPGGYDQIALMPEIVAAGYRVIVPSRPGYLGTPLASGETVAAQAAALAALLDALAIEQAAVLGMSAGGPVALRLALARPERVGALVMMSAVSQAYRPTAEATDSALGQLFVNEGGGWLLDVGTRLLEWLALRFPLAAARLMMQTESTQSATEIKARLVTMRRQPEQVAWFKALIRSTGPLSVRKTGLDNDLAQLATLPALPLAKIKAPTLVIHGRADADVDFSHAQFVADNVPQAELLPVADSGHLIWLGAAWERIRPDLLSFLRRHMNEMEMVS